MKHTCTQEYKVALISPIPKALLPGHPPRPAKAKLLAAGTKLDEIPAG